MFDNKPKTNVELLIEAQIKASIEGLIEDYGDISSDEFYNKYKQLKNDMVESFGDKQIVKDAFNRTDIVVHALRLL